MGHGRCMTWQVVGGPTVEKEKLLLLLFCFHRDWTEITVSEMKQHSLATTCTRTSLSLSLSSITVRYSIRFRLNNI